MPLPSLQDDLAEIRANAAQARGDEALAPMMAGGAGGHAPGGVDLEGAAGVLADSPIAKVGQALSGTVGWVKKLPANISKGVLDAVVATGRGMWDGLRQSIEEQFTDQEGQPTAPKGTIFAQTPAELREESDVWANTPHKVPEIALDTQAGIAYDNWRRSLSEDDTLSDGLTQGVAQFTVPFLGFSKAFAVTSAATKIGMVARGVAAEGATVYNAFDPNSGRMADLMDLGRHAEGKFGDTMRVLSPDDSLTNHYINWMTDRTGESNVEGRFKNALDNTVVSAAAAGLLKSASTTFKTARKFAQQKIEAPIPPAPKSEVKPAQSGFAETHSGLVFKDEKDAASTVEELAHQFGPGFEQRQADAWAKSSDKNFATLHSFANVLRANVDKPVSTHSLVTALEKNIKGDTETGAFYKELLGRLKEKNLGGTTTVKLGKLGKGGTTSGMYFPNTNEIHLGPGAMNTPERLLHTFTHEAVHKATVREIRESPAVSTQLERLREQTEKALRDANASAMAARREGKAAPLPHDLTTNDEYGFKNSLEFVAEIESNPRFRAELKKIKIDGVSAWDKYLKSIAGILGVAGLATNAEFSKLMDPQDQQEESPGA